MGAGSERKKLHQMACELAQVGAAAARRHFGRTFAHRKADDSPVTEADHAAQAAILQVLAVERPQDAVITEETVAEPHRHMTATTADHCWVVDPVDGTRNFHRGLPAWCTAVALLNGGRPIVGAIYDNLTDQTYSAVAGVGAWCDREPLRLKEQLHDADLTIAIASGRRRGLPPVVQDWLGKYLYRNVGSLCLHLAWTAAGLVDAAFAWECKLWDIAAGAVLIEEAGGIVSDHRGNGLWPVNPAAYHGEDLPILAGQRELHARLAATIRQNGG